MEPCRCAHQNARFSMHTAHIQKNTLHNHSPDIDPDPDTATTTAWQRSNHIAIFKPGPAEGQHQSLRTTPKEPNSIKLPPFGWVLTQIGVGTLDRSPVSTSTMQDVLAALGEAASTETPDKVLFGCHCHLPLSSCVASVINSWDVPMKNMKFCNCSCY